VEGVRRRWKKREKKYLAETGRKDDNLIPLTHPLQKVVDTRALENMEMMPVVLDLDGNDKVSLGNSFKAAVDESLVEIENKALAADVLWSDRREEGFWNTVCTDRNASATLAD
jgi:hypothetical protein